MGLRQQYGEFLATEAGGGVLALGLAAEGLGDETDHAVSDQVAMRVVDFLEVIDVGHQQARGIDRFRVLEGGIQCLVQGRTVGQAGQRIGIGLVPFAFQFLLQFGDLSRLAIEIVLHRLAGLLHLPCFVDNRAHHVAQFPDLLVLAQVVRQAVETAAVLLGIGAGAGHRFSHLLDDRRDLGTDLEQVVDIAFGDVAIEQIQVYVISKPSAGGDHVIDGAIQAGIGAGDVFEPYRVVLR